MGSLSSLRWDLPWLETPLGVGGDAHWRKIKTLGETRSGGKIILVANQRLPDSPLLPEVFVVKKVPKHRISEQRWKDNIRSVLKLNHSPHHIKHYGAWQDPEHIYLAMEYCERGDLFTAVANGNLLQTEEQQRDIAKQMLRSIDDLHIKGRVHPGLRLEHFLLTRSGHVKLGGLAPSGGEPAFGAHRRTSDLCVERKRHDAYQVGRAIFAVLNVHPGSMQPGSRDFFERLLHPEPHSRLSIADALAHPWLKQPLKDT